MVADEDLPWHIRTTSPTMQVFCGAPVTWSNAQLQGVSKGVRLRAKIPQRFRVTIKELVSPNVYAVCCQQCLERSGIIEAKHAEAPF